jgi:hypothetical protein
MILQLLSEDKVDGYKRSGRHETSDSPDYTPYQSPLWVGWHTQKDLPVLAWNLVCRKLARYDILIDRVFVEMKVLSRNSKCLKKDCTEKEESPVHPGDKSQFPCAERPEDVAFSQFEERQANGHPIHNALMTPPRTQTPIIVSKIEARLHSFILYSWWTG